MSYFTALGNLTIKAGVFGAGSLAIANTSQSGAARAARAITEV